MYVWAGAVLLAPAVGAWAGTNRRDIRPGLPPEHVAGATILALFGWERLVYLPGLLSGFWSSSAGIGTVPGLEGPQAYVAAEAAFVVAVGFAIAGTLRRRAWGAVMGVALAAAVVVFSLASFASTLQAFGVAFSDESFLSFAATSVGLNTVPALAALVLLVRPLVRSETPRTDAAIGWGGEAADRAG